MSRASTLKVRAQKLKEAREFFEERGILEIDCGALVKRAPIDPNIDCLSLNEGFLHTSPEYALKRLLSEGVGDCYFLGHVFRKEELGNIHNPEFTMAEWYRLGISLEEMIQETCAFLFLFIDKKPIRTISYRSLFNTYASIDPTKISTIELQKKAQKNWSRSECLDYILTHTIEPNLGIDELTVVRDFPKEQAALAQTRKVGDEELAERFEVYYRGIELANGYHELADPIELERRFQITNAARMRANKPPYPLDEKFLASLKLLPDCCGVALGFDRALMLHMKKESIKHVIPFAWDAL